MAPSSFHVVFVPEMNQFPPVRGVRFNGTTKGVVVDLYCVAATQPPQDQPSLQGLANRSFMERWATVCFVEDLERRTGAHVSRLHSLDAG